jgi:hypothetical protein
MSLTAPSLSAPAKEWALYYLRRGWSVVPVRRGEKIPAIPWHQFQNRRATEAEIQDWFADPTMGVGIVTGAISNLVVLDFDGELGAATEQQILDRLGAGPVSLTGGGGCHRFFSHPGRKVPTRKGILPGMDIRGDGGFIVAPPSVHASGRQYSWDVDAHVDDLGLPSLTDSMVDLICQDVIHGSGSVSPVVHAPGPLGLQGTITDGREQYMRDTVLAVVADLKAKLGRLPTEEEVVAEGWPQYASKVDFRRPGRGEAEFRMKVRYTLERAARGLVKVDRAAPVAQATQAAQEATTEDGKPRPALWQDVGQFSPTEIPKRPWLVQGYLLRGAVTVLSGQGAGGKSSMTVGWTLAGAQGKPFGGFRPEAKLTIVNYNTEDDKDEQQRRYAAAIKAQAASSEAMHQIIRCGPYSVGTLFARNLSTGQIEPTQAMQELERICMEEQADLLVCDPLAELHDSEENDNTAMRQVVAAFRTLAQRLDMAVLILHHDRKGTSTPGDMDRVRGASSISGAVRVMLTLTTMTAEEAGAFGVQADERRSYIRIDSAKSNYAPAQEAEWYKLTAIEIENGEIIAAALPWEPPSPFGNLSMAECVAILETLQKGFMEDGKHYFYAAKPTATEGAAWQVLTATGKVSDQQAKNILQAWQEEGTIFPVNGPSPANRHKRSNYNVCPEKLAQMKLVAPKPFLEGQ